MILSTIKIQVHPAHTCSYINTCQRWTRITRRCIKLRTKTTIKPRYSQIPPVSDQSETNLSVTRYNAELLNATYQTAENPQINMEKRGVKHGLQMGYTQKFDVHSSTDKTQERERERDGADDTNRKGYNRRTPLRKLSALVAITTNKKNEKIRKLFVTLEVRFFAFAEYVTDVLQEDAKHFRAVITAITRQAGQLRRHAPSPNDRYSNNATHRYGSHENDKQITKHCYTITYNLFTARTTVILLIFICIHTIKDIYLTSLNWY